MLRIAHLSDLHLNGSLDRANRLIAGISNAREAGAKHLLLTGDLTGHDKVSEFLELQNILSWEWPFQATIIPGNHDRKQNFERVFGSLGGPVDLKEAIVVPIDTRVRNRALIFRALGSVGKEQFALLNLLQQNTKPVIIAMHHGPQPHPLHFFAGLIDRRKILSLLARNSNFHVCCGHDHRVLDLVNNQVHAAASCALHPDPVRLYDIGAGMFKVAYRSMITGTTGIAGVPKS